MSHRRGGRWCWKQSLCRRSFGLGGLFTRRNISAARKLDVLSKVDSSTSSEALERAFVYSVRRHQRFPRREVDILPTALGNALTAASERAGARYGLHLPVVWPRLYPLLSPEVRELVDGRRLMLETSVSLSVAWAIAGLSSAGLLLSVETVQVLATLPIWILSWLTYRTSVDRAVAYGDALEVAVDLHRFQLYQVMRIAEPLSLDEERHTNQAISAWFSQAEWTLGPYRFDGDHSASMSPNTPSNTPSNASSTTG